MTKHQRKAVDKLEKVMSYSFYPYIEIKLPKKKFVLYRLLPLLLVLYITSACATKTESVREFSPIQSSVLQENSEDEKNTLEKLPYEELMERGNRYLQQDNPKLAMLHFQMALKRRGNSASAYAGLGETLAATGKNNTAHAFLDKALRIDNRNRQALLSTGKLYREERNYKQAEISFKRANEIYPNNPEIFTELAITYGRMGEAERAEPLLIEVINLKPRDASARNNLGFNYLLQENYPKAIETFESALKLAPRSPRILNNLAAAYALNSEPKKAFNLFRKSGSEATAYNDLGYIYMLLGKDETARASFEKAMRVSPRHYVRAKENLSLLETQSYGLIK